MIVDVMDLKFKNFQFTKKCNKDTEMSGRRLFYMENVKIKNVEKTRENEYDVDASVQGYYTNLKIEGSVITDCTCSCQIFDNKEVCMHMVATALELLYPHNASTKEGKRKLLKQKEEEERKRQEELRKKREKEIAEYEYRKKYIDTISFINEYKLNDRLDNSKNIDIMDMYTRVRSLKNEKVSELATNVKIEFAIETNNADSLLFHFKIGNTRMYSLKNINNFYNAYKNQMEINFGKQLRLIPKRENFCEDSRWLFDFIIQYAEMLNIYNSMDAYNRYYMPNRQLLIKGDRIEEFFKLIPNNKVFLKRGKEEILYEFSEQELEFMPIIQKEKVKMMYFYEDYKEKETEEYVLRMNLDHYEVVYSNRYMYIFYNNKIYKKEKDTNIIKLLSNMDMYGRMLIPENKLREFAKFVMPNIRIDAQNLPAEIQEKSLIVDKLASKVLLDVNDDGYIMLELRFCYSKGEFNILENGYEKYVKQNKIIRDVPAEKEVMKRIFLDGFAPLFNEKRFIMKNADDMYEFLTSKINVYMNDFEVLVTDKFKNKQIKRPKISSVGIKINNGLLELDISKMNIDISEIKGILQDYSVKKKYYKLKNGDFLDLTENEDLNLLDELETTLDIDYGKIKQGKINLPINRSFYIEKLMNTKENINVAKNDKFNELVDSIENAEMNFEIDKDLENKLRDYQKVGYKWLKTLETYNMGGILADDMGLGKTIQIIALLKSSIKKGNKTTSIVVCPSTLVLNWKAEIEKWCKSIKVLIVKGTAGERKQIIDTYQDYDLIITSYDLLKRDIENYEDKKFKYIIADEAQYIKNATTQNATALKSLNGEIKFALTGTPIENSIAELWSIFDFIMPGYLYNYNKFKKKFEEPIIKNEDKEALSRLKKLISPFVLRRVKKDVLTELPEKNITVMQNEMENEQQKIYLSYLAQTRKEVAEELNDSSFEKSKFKILMLLTRLRQICCHPSLFLENYNGSSGKLKQCINLVTDAVEAGHKILIFSSYTSMFEIMEKELEALKIKYFKLIGQTPVNQRIEMVDEFNNNEDIKVFLISLKAGGTGLNLTSADVVIHYDPWWNISSENQATDRTYRIGQKNSVQVYKLITSNSIEEKINKMQERKEKLSKDILSTEETFINKLSKEDILDLFA